MMVVMVIAMYQHKDKVMSVWVIVCTCECAGSTDLLPSPHHAPQVRDTVSAELVSLTGE